MVIKAPQDVVDKIESGDVDELPDFEPLPEGDYLCMVVKVEEKEAGESGYGGVNVRWEVQRPREHKGRLVFDYVSFSPKAAFRVRDFWDALQFDYDSDFEEVVNDSDALAVVEVGQEIQQKGKNKNKLQNKVTGLYEPTAEALAMIAE